VKHSQQEEENATGNHYSMSGL